MELKKLLLLAFLTLSVFLVVACAAPVEEAEVAEVVDEVEAEESMDEEAVEDMEEAEESMDEADMEEVMVVSEGDIIVYGPEGFNTDSYNVGLGESVTFVNMHVGGKNVNDEISLTFQNPNNRRNFITSDEFMYGEATSITFDEAGVWTGWTVEYGIQLEVTVTG